MTGLHLECYDIGKSMEDSGLWLQALVDDDEDEKAVEAVGAPFDPYCYIREEDLVMDPLRTCECRIGDGAPEGYLRIEADDPERIKEFRERFAFQTYEADVFYSRRVCINEDVRFLRPATEDILYFDIEVDDEGGFAQPEDAGSRVLSIAGVGGDGREIYRDDEDEEALVKGFLEEADDYIALVGWNSIGYDFEYLKTRCIEHLGFSPNWNRWVLHDLMPLYDMLGVPTKKVSTKLDDTGERELGVGKTGVQPGGGALRELWEEDPDRLREYNMRDADLVRRIDEKFGLVDVLHVICDMCGYPPGDACYKTKYGQVRFAIGQVVDALLLGVAHEKGIPQPNKGAFEKPDDFPGGYVLEPVPGMYESVVVPDYSGMYPNIVRAWNFGRETWVPDGEIEGRGDGEYVVAEGHEHEGARVILGESGGFVHPEDAGRSVPAEGADKLVSIREGASDIVDKGVKAVNNTLYGVFAADHQRYFGPHSENITLIGQKLTETVERIAGSGHKLIEDVVYGDTDSVMIQMRPGDLDPVEAAHRIARDVEGEMKNWAAGRGAMAEYLELDVDDVYDRFYIGDKKKRYFGHRIFDGEPCDNFKVRGFETRQGDWPKPARELQERLMKARLRGEDTAPIIAEARETLFSGRWDAEMATSTTLTKPIDQYDTPQPHTRAAEQLREEFGCEAAQVGDKIDYVKYGSDQTDIAWMRFGEIGVNFRPNDAWCDECERIVRTDDGEHRHNTEDFPHFRDDHYGYLWRKKFKAVMNRIGVTEGNQTKLGGFA